MSPAEALEKHVLNAAHAVGDICRGCLEPYPCDTVLLAYWAEEQLATAAALAADLIAERDAILEHYRDQRS